SVSPVCNNCTFKLVSTDNRSFYTTTECTSDCIYGASKATIIGINISTEGTTSGVNCPCEVTRTGVNVAFHPHIHKLGMPVLVNIPTVFMVPVAIVVV